MLCGYIVFDISSGKGICIYVFNYPSGKGELALIFFIRMGFGCKFFLGPSRWVGSEFPPLPESPTIWDLKMDMYFLLI